MTKTLLDLDTYKNQYFDDSGYATTPSPLSTVTMGSPMSQASGGSNSPPYNISNLTMYSPGEQPFYNNIPVGGNQSQMMQLGAYPAPSINGPHLIITENPVEKFRFRYKSEMHGTHGSLMGVKNEKSKKTYPTVELRGYNGRAVIRCSLYQTEGLKPSPHSHRLVVRHDDEDICDPHDLFVCAEDGYRAVFQGMGIIHTAKKHIVEELILKKQREKKFENNLSHLTTREEAQIKIAAEQEAKAMNLNQVRLGFQAFAINNDNSWTKLCGPIFSTPINNMKSALTGELKISRLSAAVSSAAGGDDLFLLVEKVGKKNIKVRFFEVNENDEEIWEDYGNFSEADVHHQYAIALRTPPYKDKDITRNVDVFIQLVRPSDNDRSDPVSFKYKPRNYITSRKRARMSSSSFSSSELPEPVLSNFPIDSSPKTISNEYNKSDIVKQLIGQETEPPLEYLDLCYKKSDELEKLMDFTDFLCLETDGVAAGPPQTKRQNVMSSNNFSTTPKYLEDFRKITNIARAHKSTDNFKDEILKIFDENEEGILHSIISCGDSGTIVKILKLIDTFQLYDVLQYQNERKETCLHVACIYDKSEYIKPLINLGANPNISDEKDNTPLHIAVEENMYMCAARILDKSNYTPKSKPLFIDVTNEKGLTALHLAVMKKHLKIAQKILEDGGASTKLCVSKNGNNVLHLAVEQNDENMVKYLLENTSVNINEKNRNNMTPLELAHAIKNISTNIKKMLEKYCMNCDAPDDQSTKYKPSTDGSSTESDDDDDERPLEIDEERGSSSDKEHDMSQLLDDLAIEELSTIFNKNNNWRELAKLLKLESYISTCEEVASPSKMMFNLISFGEPGSHKLDDILKAFKIMNNQEAISILQKMKMRRQM